jgi:hypothetical protein
METLACTMVIVSSSISVFIRLNIIKSNWFDKRFRLYFAIALFINITIWALLFYLQCYIVIMLLTAFLIKLEVTMYLLNKKLK